MGIDALKNSEARRPKRAFAAKRRADRIRGQATVELAIGFPALLLVALVAFNTLSFLGECAAFDRTMRNSVRVQAVSSAFRVQGDALRTNIVEDLEQIFKEENLDVSVSMRSVALGLSEYEATLYFTPTLFGQPFRSSVFGMQLPQAKHTERFVIDSYKPGVVL